MATAKKTVSTPESFESWTSVNPEALREGYEKFAGGMSKWAEFHKESVEALMASAGSLAKAFEKAASENSAFAKSAYEEGVAAFKATTSSKSVQEVLDIQSDYLRSALERNLGQLNKLSDHWVATTKQAVEPLTERYGEFVEMVQSYRP